MSSNVEQVEKQTGSKFDEMTGGAVAPIAEDEGYTPRVIYTKDSAPDIRDIQPPQLRLAQGLTAEVQDQRARVGQFVLTNFPAYDDVLLVPLAAQKIRSYKPDPKAPPQCYAPTGVHGVGNPGIVCANCDLSKWGKRDPKTGKSSKPPCQEGVSLLAYSATHRQVVSFQFMGRSQNKGAFIQQQAMALGYGNFAIQMGSSKTENNRGSWYEPRLELQLEIPEDHVAVAHKWRDAVNDMLVDPSEAAIEIAAETSA